MRPPSSGAVKPRERGTYVGSNQNSYSPNGQYGQDAQQGQYGQPLLSRTSTAVSAGCLRSAW